MQYKNNSGFTILELMIVVAVIMVLATIGYPAYQNYGKKARRAEAKTALVTLQQAQEKYRANCPQYATTIANARSCVTGSYTLQAPNEQGVIHIKDGNIYSENRYYSFIISNVTATTYTITATKAGGQAGDTDCATFVINQDGVKTATGDKASECWK
jgi:type IV pilus assembly protein PilE